MDGPLILVVDDQPGVRRLLYEVFVDDGYAVELAAGGAEALRKVKDRAPDVVLLDLHMPGLSGMETLQGFREFGLTAEVVIMTAYGEMDLVREARKMGVQWYITKPFDLTEIRCVVKTVLAGTAVGEVGKLNFLAAT